MNARVKLFGKVMPAWLVVGGLIMAASGAGVGTVLAGNITGEMPITVSQALLVGAVSFPQSDHDWTTNSGAASATSCPGCDATGPLVNTVYLSPARETLTLHHDKPDRSIGVVNDDKTSFQAAAEIDQGDKYLVQVCLSNMSRQQAITQLDLDVPAGIEAEIFGADELQSTNGETVHNVTRIGENSWKFTVDGGARSTGVVGDSAIDANSWKDCIGIQLKSDDTNPPGFYRVTGQIQQIAY